MATEKRRSRHGSDDARKKAGAGPSPDRDRAARARLPAAASETASPSATAERFVVERHHVQLFRAGAGGFQARADRLMRESRIVLLAGEAFLLGSSDDLPVIHQRGRAVVVISGDAENAHIDIRTACI